MDSFEKKSIGVITVIVPVYNSAKYLCRCLDSIINQSFSDLEIILIDDGSTDESGNICDDYASQDSRIQVVHSKNQGQSAARNIGLLGAYGEFVFFMDSDDEICVDSIQRLYDGYCRSGADCVIGDFQRVDHYGNVIRHSWKQDDVEFDKFEIREIVLEYLREKHSNKILVDAWGKLFKLSIIKNHMLCFDETMKSHENMIFVFSYLNFCEKLYYVHQFMYTYYRNQDNIASGYLMKDPLVYKKVYYYIAKTLCSEEKNIKEIVGNAFIKESIATLFLIIQRSKLKDFYQIYRMVNLIINDSDVQSNLKFYCTNNPDDVRIAPYLIKVKWVAGLIITFKLKILFSNLKMKLKSSFRKFIC